VHVDARHGVQRIGKIVSVGGTNLFSRQYRNGTGDLMQPGIDLISIDHHFVEVNG